MAERTITIRDVLKGTRIGRLQSVGLMQVIPLVSEIEDERFVSPSQSKFSTSGYGTMVFENTEDKSMIVPSHVGYVVGQMAQNHAMSHAGFVKAKMSKSFNTAQCIQQTQGGYIKNDTYPMLILPHALRESSLTKRDEHSCGKLWADIQAFNKSFGIDSGHGGHLEIFLDRFKTELDQFVAEFESIKGQVGAIVMMNGFVVGVERTPSNKFWKSVWEALIRECYGSLALYLREKSSKKATPQRVPLDNAVSNIDQLMESLEKAKEKEEEVARETIRKLIDDPFECKKEDQLSDKNVNARLLFVEHKQFIGEVVDCDDNLVYASIIIKKKWEKNRKWNEAEEFAV